MDANHDAIRRDDRFALNNGTGHSRRRRVRLTSRTDRRQFTLMLQFSLPLPLAQKTLAVYTVFEFFLGITDKRTLAPARCKAYDER